MSMDVLLSLQGLALQDVLSFGRAPEKGPETRFHAQIVEKCRNLFFDTFDKCLTMFALCEKCLKLVLDTFDDF